ncbi:hypothetical protein QBC47DRAFT_387538 [Echria macrotheca]|uniref:J domain-containing protein n=1 Tax=Echria macrotheca TaxID=438768 RepID=A0AAJ0B7B1_9PEZI|nr:hypothetical protein QBC47DRAFT_387538 [Echria macrotheca]
MITRKSAAVVCSGGVHWRFPASWITSWHHPCQRRAQGRSYASMHNSTQADAGNGNSKHSWPTSTSPTPYEIFDQVKGAPYSKARFYELVKLYHPDRHHHSLDDGIPHLTKLERYRLVVAANHILSDPERRQLYDRYGAGWGAQRDMRDSYRAADRTWRHEPGNASMNATWEDWERWYQQRDGKKQEPLYFSNGGFVVIVVLFALIGSWGHVTRASHHSADLLDMRDEKHAAISKEMRRRQSLSANLTKEDRVQHFLKQREGWGYDAPGQGHLAEARTARD